MSSELVTVAVFAISADAELVRTQLVAAGIESQLTTSGKAGPAGQIHVQVAQGDFERAMRVLFPVPEPTRAPTSEIGSWTCPKCGQSVFDFSDVCWMCGTSRQGAPTAPVLPTTQESAAAPPSSPLSPLTPPPRPTVPARRMPRFAQLPAPPAPGMAAGTDPPPAQVGVPQEGPSAVPRFARLKPVADSPVEVSEPQTHAEAGASVERSVSVERSAAAGMIAPVVPAAPAPAVAEATVAAAPLTGRWVIPGGPATRTRSPVDARRKEIESMAHWAWWTAVVGVLICPATVYSIWVLLTLTFAGARPSRAGRLRCVGAWCLNLATIIGWYLSLRYQM